MLSASKVPRFEGMPEVRRQTAFALLNWAIRKCHS